MVVFWKWIEIEDAGMKVDANVGRTVIYTDASSVKVKKNNRFLQQIHAYFCRNLPNKEKRTTGK